MIGGLLAELIRGELAAPGTQFVGGSTYNQLFTLHGTIMIFLWIIPAFVGAANYVIPLAAGPAGHGVSAAERAVVLAEHPGAPS